MSEKDPQWFEVEVLVKFQSKKVGSKGFVKKTGENTCAFFDGSVLQWFTPEECKKRFKYTFAEVSPEKQKQLSTDFIYAAHNW